MGTPLVKATIDIYNSAAATLRPTPAKPQYTFNVRDVSKVVQGVLMADKRRIASKDDLVRLWSHECCRVLADRLVDDADRGWFGGEVKRCVADHFKLTYEKVVPPDDGELLYCDFFTPGYDPTIYEQVTSFAKLSDITSEHLNEYNEQHIAMNLVLFGDAMAHVCRICRVLRQPQGNALLLGIGGSMKRRPSDASTKFWIAGTHLSGRTQRSTSSFSSLSKLLSHSPGSGCVSGSAES